MLTMSDKSHGQTSYVTGNLYPDLTQEEILV